MKTILQQNKDLDLRRYGKDVFTKANDSGSGGSVDEQSLVTEALKSVIISPPSEDNFVYPDAFIFFDIELQKYIVLDTVKALVRTGLQDITPAYKVQPTAENIYFKWGRNRFVPATLEDSAVHEATINGITYYYLTGRAA